MSKTVTIQDVALVEFSAMQKKDGLSMIAVYQLLDEKGKPMIAKQKTFEKLEMSEEELKCLEKVREFIISTIKKVEEI
ncbi:MAG: hypothetical protein NUV80_00960 [Candidatus Berkelbacteria bacterium]|nr:hypothetical protein [Candidatus Berkelbacteria bacterium]